MSIRKCPWYRSGVCYSPKTLREFGEPSNEPVNDIVCLGDYTSCKYYSEQTSQTRLDVIEERVIGVKEKSVALYLQIHTIPPDTRSECPFFEIKTVQDQSGNTVYVAYCRFLERYLTRSFIEKCVKYWRDCPFYKRQWL